MDDAQKRHDALVEAIRTLNDLADVVRACAVAARLVGEKLEETQGSLVELIEIQ